MIEIECRVQRLEMGLIKFIVLLFFFSFSVCAGYGQTDMRIQESDEPKILKNIKPLRYLKNQAVKTLKIPKRKYDSPFFCDELIQYGDGYIINSITSNRIGAKVEFTTNFFFYNSLDKSLKKISIFNADTIEALVCFENTLYASFFQRGKRDVGYFKGNQYRSLLDAAPANIRSHFDTAKWLKLGIGNNRLFLLSENYLLELSNEKWVVLTTYSLDDFYLNTLNYKRSISKLPTKNIVFNNNSVYFLQEIVQERTCNLLKLDATTGMVEDYFTSLDYTDSYLKQISDFTFLSDGSLLVSASRLIQSQILINTANKTVQVWAFNNKIVTIDGTSVEMPVSTALSIGDTVILASNQGLYLKCLDSVTPLAHFDNTHQRIKDDIGIIDFDFTPRSIKRNSDNTFLVGGMWGGLYKVDILKGKITCLDDIDYDKIKIVDLLEL